MSRNLEMMQKLVEDLGLSSLDRFEATMNLEERFGIELTPPEQDGLVTIGDAVRFIRSKVLCTVTLLCWRVEQASSVWPNVARAGHCGRTSISLQ